MAWSCDGTRRVLVVNIIQQSESLAQAVPVVNPLSSMCSFLVAPPSVGPTKVKLDQSFNQGGFVEKKPGYEGLHYNPSEDTACQTYTRQGDKERNHIAQASRHGTAFILRSIALRASVENPPIEAFLEG
ncbi:hypothetical protein C8F04DRAFT_1196965 [Mycena alexandri]|uniref:Uncharacterized protein n=1 Tax=Mycena alexandri TaxID=1745969 RepID=A0AAD6WTB7_9AGAR|nr:hypothetical protein C8F04DRAFT_1196965 [Mycena alexandri]